MKRLFLLSIFTLSLFVANAQITITSANAPSIGDNLQMHDIFEPETVLEGDAGANIIWDFSQNVETDLQIFGYIDPAGLPVLASMNAPQIGETINSQTNGYFYFGVDAADGDWMRHGFWGDDGAGTEVWTAYDTPLKMYDYPFTYQDTHSVVDFTGTGMMGDFASTIASTAYEYTCDAYGTLILPHRIHANAVRVHITEAFTITVDLGLGGPTSVATITDNSYYWFVEGVKGPVMTIINSQTEDLIGGSGTSTLNSARWYRADAAEITSDFIVNETAGDTFTDFVFTNASYPMIASTFAWEFTPNTIQYLNGTSATDANPEVRFLEPGLYTAALTTTNSGFAPDAVTETKVEYMDIVAADELVVDFTGDVLTPVINGTTLLTPTVSISDLSNIIGTTTYSWLVDGNGIDFWPVEGADYNYVGGTTSTNEIPRVQFITMGCYRIELVATNVDYGNSPVTISKPSYISVAGGCSVGVDVLSSETKIYPNPSNGIMFIEGATNSEITVRNITGQVVLKQKNVTSIDLTKQTKGIYMISINSNNKVETFKIVLK